VSLTLRDAQNGQRILPVFYSDNYFSLLPGESRKFRVDTRSKTGTVEVTVDGWNIEPGPLK
jgi:hypothetical protein